MLTWEKVVGFHGGKVYREGACLSTDTKPESDNTMMNGSKLFEMDTATLYMYDEENGEWRAWSE